MRYRVSFKSGHAPVCLDERAELSRELDVSNSPLLFGCRTGVCGTCAVEVEVVSGTLAPPDDEEAEVLEIVCPENPRARLACQLELTADVRLAKL